MNLSHVAPLFRACVLSVPIALAVGNADARSFTLDVRILTPLTSLLSATQDQSVEAMTIQPLIRDGQILMPAHSLLHGKVRRARGVGIGLRRERASLDIGFTDWETPEGERLPLEATPLSIDNAREQVDKKGRIQGILAASNPLGIVRGMWYRPTSHLFLRAPAGLSGAGSVWAKLALGPVGAIGLLAARLLITRMPEPEIELPIGTEMTLQVSSLAVERSWGTVPLASSLEPELVQFLQAQPVQIEKMDETLTADIINLALMGSAQMVEASFRSAGWVGADSLSRGSFARTYKAFTQRQGYATSPVSKLYYQGRLPDLVFQKSLNSIAKRHHVRLWRVTTDSGEEAWLGAATHDVTVIFDRKNFGLSHRIDLNIDLERQKIISDLDFAEALVGTTYVPRTLSFTEGTRTDSALAVAYLKDTAAMKDVTSPQKARGSKLLALRKFTRRMVLETRQYVLRENAYYLAYWAGRKLLARSRGVPLDVGGEVEASSLVTAAVPSSGPDASGD